MVRIRSSCSGPLPICDLLLNLILTLAVLSNLLICDANPLMTVRVFERNIRVDHASDGQTLPEVEPETREDSLTHAGMRSSNSSGFSSLPQLGLMLFCTTKREPLAYDDYGCFCGPGNTGDTPVDGVDACCKTHDLCYDEFERVCSKSAYFTNYKWTGRPKCTNSTLKCVDDDLCRRRLCECDRSLSLCLTEQNYHNEYHFGLAKYLPSWASKESALFHKLCKN